jgi:excinuclease UvrABC helicase subunit UvrB
MISFKDKEAQTIKQNAYNTVKQLSTKQAVQQTKAKTQTQPVSEVNETIKMINEQIQKALLEGNIETASKLTNMITQLTNPQTKPVVEETNEEEVPEDVQEEVVDETIDSDEIEL